LLDSVDGRGDSAAKCGSRGSEWGGTFDRQNERELELGAVAVVQLREVRHLCRGQGVETSSRLLALQRVG
jgi:hypothetical protein